MTPDKRKAAPTGTKGGSIFDSSNSKIELVNYSTPKNPSATPANGLITIHEACDRSGEKPAVIIGWCVRYKIGSHVKIDSGGAWMVDPDRLEQLLAEQQAEA